MRPGTVRTTVMASFIRTRGRAPSNRGARGVPNPCRPTLEHITERPERAAERPGHGRQLASGAAFRRSASPTARAQTPRRASSSPRTSRKRRRGRRSDAARRTRRAPRIPNKTPHHPSSHNYGPGPRSAASVTEQFAYRPPSPRRHDGRGGEVLDNSLVLFISTTVGRRRLQQGARHRAVWVAPSRPRATS